jgi:hypothetical protein
MLFDVESRPRRDASLLHPSMTRTTTYCGTLWTLRRDGKTARAEIVEIVGIGLELRCTRNDKSFVRFIFDDGAELLREAAIERFELEARGWSDKLTANAARRFRRRDN